MNKLFYIGLLALIFASCENSGNRRTVDTVPPTPVTVNNTPLVTPDSAKSAAIKTVSAPANNNAPKVGANPEHGAPGHRCDIPVGAPLNSPAVSTQLPATTNTNSAPVKTTTPSQALPVNSKARLNPEHGQPGHDCAIPVGQPLKS